LDAGAIDDANAGALVARVQMTVERYQDLKDRWQRENAARHASFMARERAAIGADRLADRRGAGDRRRGRVSGALRRAMRQLAAPASTAK
jgi:hypothetical protein